MTGLELHTHLRHEGINHVLEIRVVEGLEDYIAILTWCSRTS